MLTGIVDIDKVVLYQLPLHHLHQVCSVNRSIYQLCQHDNQIQYRLKEASMRANHIIDALEHRQKLTLNIKNEREKFHTINDILQLTTSVMIDDSYDYQDINQIVLEHRYNGIILRFELSDEDTTEDIRSKAVNSKKLVQFLRHLFYDDLILTI